METVTINQVNELINEIKELKDLLKEKESPDKLVYTTKELSLLLGYKNNTNKVDQLRRVGAIKAIKRGQGYLFTKYSVEEFLRTFDGKDISNLKAIKKEKKDKIKNA